MKFGFVDPSGGISDSFTFAIANRSILGKAILLGAWEWKAPFSPKVVVRGIADICKQYGIRTVTGDHYSAFWVIEGFRECEIVYEPSKLTKSEIYSEALVIARDGRAVIPNSKRLRGQLIGLRREFSSRGHESVDHPSRGKDDLANAACGALVLAARAKRKLWHPELMSFPSPGNSLATSRRREGTWTECESISDAIDYARGSLSSALQAGIIPSRR